MIDECFNCGHNLYKLKGELSFKHTYEATVYKDNKPDHVICGSDEWDCGCISPVPLSLLKQSDKTGEKP